MKLVKIEENFKEKEEDGGGGSLVVGFLKIESQCENTEEER